LADRASLPHPPARLYGQQMARRFDHPPSADEIEAVARDAMRRLPEPFAGHLRDVVLQVDEYADDELLGELGIEHPLDLTGVYEGIPISQRSVDTSGTLPDRIRLFRQAILAEWAEEGEPFEHLVRHILIHEVGHHFGLSDADMHALEDQA
jgi:predicted Zn-dependent protease with MMP-like domain